MWHSQRQIFTHNYCHSQLCWVEGCNSYLVIILKVGKGTGSSLSSGRDCRGGGGGGWVNIQRSLHPQYHDWGETFKQGNPPNFNQSSLINQLLPGCCSIGCPLLRVCVHGLYVHVCSLLTAVCVCTFQVWVTILGHTSRPFLSFFFRNTSSRVEGYSYLSWVCGGNWKDSVGTTTGACGCKSKNS